MSISEVVQKLIMLKLLYTESTYRVNTMLLLFMRHGKAEEKKPGIKDEDRRLTDEGRRDAEYIARVLPVKPSIVYSSPLTRARETAEIIARLHGVSLKIVDELSPSKASLDSIRKLELINNTLLVGHAPSIENIVSEIIGGGNIKLKAGAVAGVELEEVGRGKGKLVFLITPQIARILVG